MSADAAPVISSLLIGAQLSEQPGPNGISLKATDGPTHMHVQKLEDAPSHFHVEHLGGHPGPLTFWIGDAKVDVPEETALAISQQITAICRNFPGLTFKSLNITKAVIHFVDKEGKEHTFPLDHDTCPGLKNIVKIIEHDEKICKMVCVHNFQIFNSHFKGNVRAETSLSSKTLTPRLEKNASRSLDEAVQKFSDTPPDIKKRKRRALAFLAARAEAVEKLLKKTEEEIAKNVAQSAAHALLAKKKKLEDLLLSLGTDYDAIAYGLANDFIDSRLPVEEQVKLAEQHAAALISQVEKQRPGNRRSSPEVLHDPQHGQEYYWFKDTFRRKENQVLQLERDRMRSIAGMLIGGPGNRRAYTAFMQDKPERDPDELAVLRFAVRGETSDAIRSGQLPVVWTGDDLVDREIHGEMSTALGAWENREQAREAKEKEKEKAAALKGKDDADPSLMPDADLEIPSESESGSDSSGSSTSGTIADLQPTGSESGQGSPLGSERSDSSSSLQPSKKSPDLDDDLGMFSALDALQDDSPNWIGSNVNRFPRTFSSLPLALQQHVQALSQGEEVNAFYRRRQSDPTFWAQIQARANIPTTNESALASVQKYYDQRNEVIWQLIGSIDEDQRIRQGINSHAKDPLDCISKAQAIEHWLKQGNNAETLIKGAFDNMDHNRGVQPGTLRILIETCLEANIQIPRDLAQSINQFYIEFGVPAPFPTHYFGRVEDPAQAQVQSSESWWKWGKRKLGSALQTAWDASG